MPTKQQILTKRIEEIEATADDRVQVKLKDGSIVLVPWDKPWEAMRYVDQATASGNEEALSFLESIACVNEPWMRLAMVYYRSIKRIQQEDAQEKDQDATKD